MFSPAHLLTYRGDVPASPTRFETIEWLRVGEGDEGEMKSIHSESLKGKDDDDELCVMVSTKQLSEADMQREICVQLWTHSDDIETVDLDSDVMPEHDLLTQFTATITEMAEFTHAEAAEDSDGADEDGGEESEERGRERERRRQIADFFQVVEVVLHENEELAAIVRARELEMQIEEQRSRRQQQDRETASAKKTAAKQPQRTPTKTSAPASASTTPVRRRSLTNLLAPTQSSSQAHAPSQSSNVSPALLDDFAELILPDRVWSRRQRMKAEERKKKKHLDASRTSPSSSQTSSPQVSPRSLTFVPFEPVYYRVRVSVSELPKMNFHGTADSYFHILLASSASSAPSSWMSVYRSEVQFNQLHPRFASFVLSSVRERDMQRHILLRMVNWRQRVEKGHEEVIGEIRMELSRLIPAATANQADLPPLVLRLVNPVREYIKMKTAEVGVVRFTYEALGGSTVTVDTMPSSAMKSVKQLNADEKKPVQHAQRLTKGKAVTNEREKDRADA